MLMNDVSLLTEQLRAKNSQIEDYENRLKQRPQISVAPLSIDLVKEPLTPTHMSTKGESAAGSNQVMSTKGESEKPLPPILRAYTGPPQGVDGKIFRGNVEMGHYNEAVISKDDEDLMMIRGEQIGPNGGLHLKKSMTSRYKILDKNSRERQIFTDSILTEKQAKEQMRKRSLH